MKMSGRANRLGLWPQTEGLLRLRSHSEELSPAAAGATLRDGIFLAVCTKRVRACVWAYVLYMGAVCCVLRQKEVMKKMKRSFLFLLFVSNVK